MAATPLTSLTSEGEDTAFKFSGVVTDLDSSEVPLLRPLRRPLRFSARIPRSRASSSTSSEVSQFLSHMFPVSDCCCLGIMRCDYIAEGVIKAAQELNMNIPLVVRLKGTKEAEAKA